MQIIHGVITGAGALGIMQVRRLGGGMLSILPSDKYGIGDKVVLIWDSIRQAVHEVYTLAEWELSRTDDGHELPDPGKEDEVCEPALPLEELDHDEW